MKEIVIAGGGLAGLSLGIALSKRGVPVMLREAGSYPRHRVCGEFINGVTLETLNSLGIAHLFDDALRHGSTRWWVGNRRVLQATLPRPALGMSRWEMDERLRGEFESVGGKLVTRARVSCEPSEGLVWAAGRRLDRKSTLLGLKAHFEGVELDGFLEMHLGNGCYLGLTPVSADGSRVNVCGLFQGYAHARDENPIVSALRRGGLADLAARLEGGEMDSKSLTGISGIGLGGQQGSPELMSLGDAERMIPPFTGNGMSMAFESAECALDPLLKYSEGRGSWKSAREEVCSALDRRFRSRVNLAMKLHRCLMNPLGCEVISVAARTGVLPFSWLHRRLS